MAAPPYAFVTLITSDHYLPGGLVLAAALRDVHKSPPDSPDELDPSEFHRVCLVSPETVNVDTIKQLRKAFDVVIGVEVIEQHDKDGLALLGRLDLTNVLTKLHVFRLTSYKKVIFMDADILPLQPISHLFHLKSAFAAVPDVGWPDIFNSGFFVMEPAEEKFNEVGEFVKNRGSWDGGDQGVLNEWVGQNWERLSFTYNTTPTAIYTYAPAYKRFGSQIKNIHFIGPNKPWNSIPFRSPGTTSKSSPSDTAISTYEFGALLDRWFEVYDRHYRAESTSFVGFPTPDAVPSKVEEPVSRRYLNVWSISPSEASSTPLGLEELRRLAIEGVGQVETGFDSGEAIYRTMPLEGRVDLMRPREIVSDAEAQTPSPQRIRIIVPESPHTPSRTPSHMTTLPTPGPDELPPAPHFRGQSLPPETPTYSRATRSLFDTPTHSHLHPPPRTYSPSPLAKSSSPPSPPLLLWNPAVEEPPKEVPSVSSFPEDTFFPNVWDAPSQGKHDMQDPDLFVIPPPPPIPEMLLKEGHYKNVIGESPSTHHHTESHGHQEAHTSVMGANQLEHESSDNSPIEISSKMGVTVSFQPQQVQGPTAVSSDHPYGDIQVRHAHAQTTQQGVTSHQVHEQLHKESPKTFYPQPDRRKVAAVFPWEQRPRPAPQRYYPRTDSPPPGEPFIQGRPPLEITTKPQATRVFPSDSISAGGGFPRTTSYGNAWDSIPSIQRYASRLVRPPIIPQPVPPSGSGRNRKGSGASVTLDDYRRRQEIEELSSHDADDEDEDDEDGKSTEGESVKGTGPLRLPPQPIKKYKVKGIQTMKRTMKDQYVQVQSDVSGRHRSRSLSGRSADLNVRERKLSLQGQGPSARPPEVSVGLVEEKTKNGLSILPSLPTVGISSVPHGEPIASSSARSTVSKPRPPGRKFDPARGVDVFKRGSEEVLARFLQMDSWEEQQNAPEVLSAPLVGTPLLPINK